MSCHETICGNDDDDDDDDDNEKETNMPVLAMGLGYFYEFSYRPGVRKLIIRMGLGVNGFGVSVQDYFFGFFEHRKKP